MPYFDFTAALSMPLTTRVSPTTFANDQLGASAALLSFSFGPLPLRTKLRLAVR